MITHNDPPNPCIPYSKPKPMTMNYFGGGIENQCEKAVEMLKNYPDGIFFDRYHERPGLYFFKVYCNRLKAPEARFFYNRLRQLPEKEANIFLRGKLRSMRTSLCA